MKLGIFPKLTDSNTVEYDTVHALKWFIEIYPFLEPHERPIECTQEPGELLFVPSGWW
jgi:hypothetical protein